MFTRPQVERREDADSGDRQHGEDTVDHESRRQELAGAVWRVIRLGDFRTADADVDVEHVLHELLPLDDERRAENEVWLAFSARAMVDPDLRTLHLDSLTL